MSAEIIARALHGRRAGSGWMARCPVHEDRTPSLSLRDADDGKVLVRCHAGCTQDALISNLRTNGLWPKNDTRLPRPYTPDRVPSSAAAGADDEKRSEAALSIWRGSRPSAGTLVETYLSSRGLNLPSTARLRFQPALKHSTGGIWPGMIALVTRGTDDMPQAVHRTFLAHDGAGKAPVGTQKMMLGPCRGGAVRLAPAGDVLMIGEGIETCLAAMQVTRHPAWAALSTSGLRTLNLPSSVRDIIVLADGDDPGEAAARDCAARWMREGRRVRIARPPRGMDFNDISVRVMSCIEDAGR